MRPGRVDGSGARPAPAQGAYTQPDDVARGLARTLRTKLRRLEREVVETRRLCAALLDQLDPDERTPEEGNRDEDRNAAEAARDEAERARAA